MTDQCRQTQSGVLRNNVGKTKQLIQQLSSRFAKKPSDTGYALQPKKAPIITKLKSQHSQQHLTDSTQNSRFLDIINEQNTQVSRDRMSRLSTRFQNNFDHDNVLVILPNEQQKNATFRRISSKFSQEMEDYHQRQTLSKDRVVESRLNFLMDQWFLYPEQQNKVTKGVPVLIIKTIAHILDLEVPHNISQADRRSSVLINRDQFI